MHKCTVCNKWWTPAHECAIEDLEKRIDELDQILETPLGKRWRFVYRPKREALAKMVAIKRNS